ncbi:MAG: bifunctional 4-hydroxy-2-oxoglutarate aldolase/2-dehydro-3-deoxy-phosphogluconate aldolase [Kiritimatiellae bacterium]|nr:bifunctional 4-hydroxy-2-oxoglutarate aldolase/2-dehydro-3-deoxy-phosphogluconate aldolase [Kiritimatiellia bacterium]
MNRKEEVKASLATTKVVAIIRGMAPEVCVRLAKAYHEGGIRLVEVTFDQTGDPEATVAAIRAVREAFPDMHVGAGTVVTAAQLDRAIDAGAEFIVTPNCNPQIISAAGAAGLVTMPGTFTPTEMEVANEAGADYVKVFPVRALGPAYVKDVLAPLKHLKLIAVGGVSPENAADYIKAGCVGVGASGSLVNKEWIAAGEYGRIADVARRLVENCR